MTDEFDIGFFMKRARAAGETLRRRRTTTPTGSPSWPDTDSLIRILSTAKDVLVATARGSTCTAELWVFSRTFAPERAAGASRRHYSDILPAL